VCRDVVIVEGMQQIQDHMGMRNGWRCSQKRIHLVAGEGAPAVQAIGDHLHFHGFSSDEHGDLIRFVPVAAIQNGDRPAQTEFGD